MNLVRRLRKWWFCRKYGICPVHGVLRPHGGYNAGKWDICPKCREENSGKSYMRDLAFAQQRHAALERLNRDWMPKRAEDHVNEG